VSHAVAPWRWPKYYSNDWLSYVNEKHTHYCVELRQEDGSFLTQSELIPRSYHHPTRDLAILHLAEEESTVELLKKLGVETDLRSHSDDYTEPAVRDVKPLFLKLSIGPFTLFHYFP
jgi:hypothetical protein